MSKFPDSSQNKADLQLVSKCRSKNGSLASSSASGGCGCKRRDPPPLAAEETPHLPETASVETATLVAAAETTTGTATIEETPPKTGCGCGHHAAESTATQTEEAAAGSSCKCQKLRWIRKTHAALGLLFGLFLVEHFTATSLGLRPVLFEQHVQGVHAVLRQMPWLELLVFIPLVALIPFGLYLLAKAGLRYNVKKCNRGGKLRFFLQRISAVMILAFIAFHLLTLRDWGPRFARADAERSTLATVAGNSTPAAFATSVWQIWDFLPSTGAPSPLRCTVAAFYLLGMTAAIYHLANGLWTGAIAWGVTQSPSAQLRSLWVSTAVGIILLLLGTLGWYAFIVAPWSGATG